MTQTDTGHRRAGRPRTGFRAGLRRCAVTATVLAALSPAASAAAVICSDDVMPADEAKAVRVLQSEMMVAALACDARGHYGRFVERYKADLVGSGKALQKHFSATHGKKRGVAELNSFVTRQANKASGRMASLGADFCSTALETYSDLLSADGVDLAGFSLSYANRIVESEHEAGQSCGPDKVAIAPNG